MYNNLEWVQSLLSTKSTSLFSFSRSTSAHRVNAQDACGALADVKRQCSAETVLIVDCYCLEDKEVQVQDLIRAKLRLALRADKRDDTNLNKLADIVFGRVYKGQFVTKVACGKYLNGMSHVGYAKTWHQYVDAVESEIEQMLLNADMIVCEYRYRHNRE
ncbi:hypothetical protein [Psychrobacter pygoscelis]|uniref:hypothetical protein n=1 Tax=Psychrobacter pygoscelis TaxID=2488563 RepID=UPI00103C0B34|nr:hypothetical protein [Psychrobacter pygoscelis]